MITSKGTRIILLAAMLAISGQGKAWIAFGFKSGMSRLDVTRHLYDRESFVITDNGLQTRAGPDGNRSQYNMVYCASPQKLYLMRFSLEDSLQAFVQTKAKFEKRYGQPTALNAASDYQDPETWKNVDVAFIWDLNESETILLRHDRDGTSAEFQDLSVCE